MGDSKAWKLIEVSVERKKNWQHSNQCVFPGHKRLAAPNRDYPPPLGSPCDEQQRQNKRCGKTLKETVTEERKYGEKLNVKACALGRGKTHASIDSDPHICQLHLRTCRCSR